jgi:tetratricopeptide (TPR) repeat protein
MRRSSPSDRSETSPLDIPDELIRQLREDLAWRRIESGIYRLNANTALLENCHPAQHGSAKLLGFAAQWVDVGFPGHAPVRKILSRFPDSMRESLSLVDYVHVRMAEGLLAMSEEDFGNAVQHFNMVLGLEKEIRDKLLVSIAHFWMGRCLRRQARYNDALEYVRRGRDIALELKFSKMAAVMRVLEGWIAFQEGKSAEASRALAEAESELADTDDFVTRGNISSAYGRLARRQGNYQLALAQFTRAIVEYNKRDPYNRNLARTFVNIAFVKRLFALQVRDKLDLQAARLRKGRPTSAAIRRTKGDDRELLSRLRDEAFEHLSKAREIYNRYDDHRGNGNIYITFGYLHLDDGELDRATEMAATAFRLGDEKKDNLLKCRARMLQCAVESAKCEEQIEEGGGTSSSQTACEFAREALDFARHTQNRRLVAKAHIALGLALCLDFSDDTDTARQCAEEASALLKAGSHDYVWKELQTLKRKLSSAGTINASLRDWSRGVVDGKSFQQVSDEFAAMVIPKVWRREGCKVARVANRLSISPKKVRRILRDQGLLDPVDDRS